MAATMASLGAARSTKLNKLIGALRQLQVSQVLNFNNDQQPHRSMSLGPPFGQEDSRHKSSNFLPLIPNLYNRHAVHGSQNGFSPHRTFLWKSFFGGPTEEKPPEKAVNVKPKLPPNVFIVYLSKIEGQIFRENPGIKRPDMVKIAAKMWKDIHPDERARIYADRREKYLKYKEAEKLYMENITPEQIREEQTKRRKKEDDKLKKTRAHLGMPKRPRTGFAEFMMESYTSTPIKGISAKEHFLMTSQKWKTTDESTKQKYQEVSMKNREAYEQQMKDWESQMVAAGRYDVLRKTTLERLRKAAQQEKVKAGKSSDKTEIKAERKKAKTARVK